MMKKAGNLNAGRCRGCPYHTGPGGCANRVVRSGRCGDWVYYLRDGKRCRRRYVKPQDPRTPAQVRVRTVLGEASQAWSYSRELTEADRQAWRAAGARVRSRPRLGLPGVLTGQLQYVGRSCARGRRGAGLLLGPPGWGEEKAECRMENAKASVQAAQLQGVTRSTWELHRSITIAAPGYRAGGARGRRGLRLGARGCGGNDKRPRANGKLNARGCARGGEAGGVEEVWWKWRGTGRRERGAPVAVGRPERIGWPGRCRGR